MQENHDLPRSKKEAEGRITLLAWDYNIDPYEIDEVAFGSKEVVGPFRKTTAFARCLTATTWSNLIYLFGVERIKERLDDKVLAQIWPSSLKEHFETLRDLLQGKSVPVSRLGTSFGHGPRPILVSDRWYRT